MKLLLTAAAAVTAALTLTGCPNRDPEPVPPPRTSTGGQSLKVKPVTRSGTSGTAPAAEISYFQGTLDEAFTRRPRTDDRPEFR
jgi:hypothetical protein